MAKLILSLVLLVTAAVVPWQSGGTMDEDEKECADQLQNLASCIPYVSGSAARPTAECCDAVEKLRSSEPKCLCVLIVESTDPSISLPINTTLALHMPAACHSNAKVSDCPSILKLPPGSPDAKVFKDAGGTAETTPSSSSTGSSSASSSSGSSDSSASGGGSGSTAAPKSEGGRVQGFVSGSVVSLMTSMITVLLV